MKKYSCHLLYGDAISFFVTRKCQKIQKFYGNSWYEGENVMTSLKVTKKQGFSLSLALSLSRTCIFGKTTLGGQIDPFPAFLGLMLSLKYFY